LVVLWSVYVAVRPAKTLVVYYSSAFILRIECTNCNIKPVGVKPSLQLQQLTLHPYLWDTTSDPSAVLLKLALMDAVPRQKIADGRIAVVLGRRQRLPFVCEHGSLLYSMVVHSAQPSYARNQHGDTRVSFRKNSRELPLFAAGAVPERPRTEEDDLLQDIHHTLCTLDRLMLFFLLPAL
jgi:hypothetical protein